VRRKRMTKKKILIGIGVGLAVVFGVYFWFFFQRGIILEDTFLRRHEVGQDVIYSGTVSSHETEVSVTREGVKRCTVVFSQEPVRKIYSLEGGKMDSAGFQHLTVYEEGNLLFEGKYDPNPGTAYPYVYHGDGMPYLDDMITIRVDGEPDTIDGLTVSKLVDLFCGREERRGDGALLAIAVLLLAVWIVDMSFPNFFFFIRYALSVQNPEPSDWYRAGQRISWVIYPLVAAGILTASLL